MVLGLVNPASPAGGRLIRVPFSGRGTTLKKSVQASGNENNLEEFEINYGSV